MLYTVYGILTLLDKVTWAEFEAAALMSTEKAQWISLNHKSAHFSSVLKNNSMTEHSDQEPN